jgi:VWFA-related protein
MTRLLLALTLCVLAMDAHAQPPQFRSSVDLTRVDVTVLDTRTRQPVRGLTADDFVVRIAGQHREVTAFAEVEAPTAAATVGVNAVRDVASNADSVDRLFIIVMDDTFEGASLDPFNRAEARRIGQAVIDALAPGDMAAVIFSQDNRHAVDFTADRAALRQAVDTYSPRSLHPRLALAMSLGTLRRAREALLPMSGYRRAVIWITPGPSVNLSRSGEPLSALANSIDPDDQASAAMQGLQRIVRQGALSAVPIYAFSTAGLMAPTRSEVQQGRMPRTDTNLFMASVAAESGGDAYLETNAPSRDVPRMFTELSSYYTLGVAGGPAPTGRSQRLQIAVTRPDVEVVPASVWFATPSATGSDDRRPATGLTAALASPLSTGTIPLRMGLVPMAVAGQREQALVLTLALPRPAMAPETAAYTVRLFVYDGEGRREIQQSEHAVTVGEAGDTLAEVLLRLALRPGRYNVRAYVERAGTDRAGSVFAQVTVPDFVREPVSLSGVAIGLAESRPPAGRETIAGLLPFGPTAAREFRSTDRIGALWRVHANTRQSAVSQRVEVLDERGNEMFSRDTMVPVDAQLGSGVEQRFDVPLSSLPPGDYVLRIVVSLGGANAQRDVRFRVQR